MDSVEALVWYIHVPIKVSIFAWRLLRDRLPTRTNLVHRGVLPGAAAGCLSGCGVIETSQHLFISVIFMALFGIRCGLGLESQAQTLFMSQIISFSSLILQVVCEQGALFCSLFGCFLRGSYGMIVIIGCLTIQLVP